MELTVKSRNGKVTERQRSHIEEKLSKLGRYMDGITSATVEVHTEQQRNAGEMNRVQVTLVGDHGVILRAEEQAPDLYHAIDEVQEVLERQIKRYKEKFWRRGRSRRSRDVVVEPEPIAALAPGEAAARGSQATDEEAPAIPQLIRTKEFTVRPMFAEDAIEQMELLGHNFFVFQDAETQRLSVLYRRRDGNYGVIVPQMA
ncbi:MAG TPA: ribosome-associated translation inhibitor RaiA [Chloroflexaceae bacterium]|nr:ribosome-associated translation inhibitor RaiA [Chloroflexaceae bacterium]